MAAAATNHTHRRPRPRTVPTSISEIVPTPGVCIVCGCTDDAACEGGCSWVDEGHLCCSRCCLLMGAVVLQAVATAGGADLHVPPPKKGRKRG